MTVVGRYRVETARAGFESALLVYRMLYRRNVRNSGDERFEYPDMNDTILHLYEV